MESTSLTAYLTSLQNLSEQDKELTHCAKLESLLENLAQILSSQRAECKNIKIIHQPPNDKEGKGAPDFLITKDSLVLGYVENKRVNAKLDEVAQSPQIRKYFTLSPNIILTDYLRFCLLHQDDRGEIHIERECKICELSELKAIVKNPKLCDLDSKASELLELFALFFTRTPKPINTAKEFANALALRTRILKDELESNEDNRHISAVFHTFKDALYKELEFKDFADSFAQTLTYSLFLSRLNSPSGKDIDLDNAYNFIPKSFPLIRAINKLLSELKELDSIKWLLDEIIAIANHIDIASIISELNQLSQKNLLGEYMYKDPYLHFYEDFLESYDFNLRRLRGVYYTPAPVVEFIIDSIDLLLQKDFKKQGLKAAMSDEKITLLDFATGTGTFLLQAFRKALESSDKGTPSFVLKSLIERFYGFEFLIAPYTIAHLKISQALKDEFHISLNENESLNIALTNTLYFNPLKDEINKQSNLFVGMIELVEEFQKAQSIKEQDILIITGNPPYNATSINKYDINDYKYCGLDENNSKIPINERKHRLNDDYIKFIRFAQNKIDKQEKGIIALITNNSFLDAVTMNGMRWNLLNSFDKIYLLNLHGDSNKQEVCPNGDKDENVFDIKQGVGISIFVKTKHKKSLSNTPKCEVLYYDLYGKRKDKYKFLKEQSLDSINWTTLKPSFPKYEFFIQDDGVRAEYDKGFSVKDIFRVSGLGICSYRDKFCYADSKDELKNRLEIFRKLDAESARQHFNLPKDTRDWTIKEAQKEINDTNLDEKFIQKVHFKPFDFKYTYFTGKSKRFLGCPAGVVQNLMLQNNIGLVCYRTCGGIVDNIFIANSLIDLHLVGSGSNIFPLYNDSLASSENLSLDFRTFIDSKYQWEQSDYEANREFFINSKIFDEKCGLQEKSQGSYLSGNDRRDFSPLPHLSQKAEFILTPEAIMGYIYAVLFHKEYREKYLDFLKIDFPKIPFVESKELFLEFSTLGQELLSVHLLQDTSLDSHIGTLHARDKTESKIIEKPHYNKETKELSINNSLYFANVDSKVWEYKIGGYQVLDKYLKSHKGEEIDYKHFQNIIRALTKSLEIESRISSLPL